MNQITSDTKAAGLDSAIDATIVSAPELFAAAQAGHPSALNLLAIQVTQRHKCVSRATAAARLHVRMALERIKQSAYPQLTTEEELAKAVEAGTVIGITAAMESEMPKSQPNSYPIADSATLGLRMATAPFEQPKSLVEALASNPS